MPDWPPELGAALAERYRIERKLGQGGMAVVYLAEDLKHGRNVALKVLKPGVAAGVGADRFLTEIRTTANLQHPHILPLFDSGEADGFLYYVMPYVEGESLRERLSRERQLPVDDAVKLAAHLATALQAAHERGVVHRDIKPANILLSNGQPLLADFGIALAVRGRGEDHLTETGMSLGTPAYMSPEQATGDESVGPATDIYALGTVLYEMLAGQPPYAGSSPQAILGKILTSGPVSVSELRPTVPPHVEAVVRRAMERIPADRFGSSGEMARALRDVGFRHEAVPSGPSGPEGVPGFRVPGGWRGGGVLAAIAAVIAFLVVVRPSVPAPNAGATCRSIAVLPPVDMSPSQDQAYFGDGIAEELINALGRLPELNRVPARSSTFRLRDADIGTVSEQLDVCSVLESSVRREGGRVVVIARLIEASSLSPLWSGEYDREVGSVIDIQEEIAGEVVEALSIELGGRTVAMAAQTSHPEAYDEYLRGRDDWIARSGRLDSALVHFRRAATLDDRFALAFSGLADTYVLLYEYNMRGEEALDLAEAAANSALALDPSLAEAHTSRAEILAARRQWEEAEASFRHALELNPRYLTARHWYGWLLAHLARHGDAIAQLEFAKELDPLSAVVRRDLAGALHHARRFEEAIAESDQCFALDLHPTCAGISFNRSRALLSLGRPQEVLAMRGDTTLTPELELMALAGSGRESEARAILDEYLEEQPRPLDRPISHLYLVEMYTALGYEDRALSSLRDAVERGLSTGPVLVREWPQYDRIRSLPAFDAMLESMGYPPL